MRIATVMCIALALAGTVVTTAAGQPVLPAEWQGIWAATTTTTTPCEGGTPFQSARNDTLCAGEPAFDNDGSGTEVQCTGTVDATAVDITCTSTFTEEGCTITTVTHYTGSRNGETYMVSGQSTSTASDPKVCGFDSICSSFETSATRIDTSPKMCATLVDFARWATIKTHYR